jgi:hypothetical protein
MKWNEAKLAGKQLYLKVLTNRILVRAFKLKEDGKRFRRHRVIGKAGLAITK